MSSSCKRPSLAIHFTWKQDWPSVRKVLPMDSKMELVLFEVRPHWGKLFTIPLCAAPEAIRHGRGQFKRVVANHDPHWIIF